METVTLVSNDGKEYDVELKVAKCCKTIGNLIEDTQATRVVLDQVGSNELVKIVEYSKYHLENPDQYVDCEWNLNFCDLEHESLFSLLLAANYLENKPLLDLTCKTVANMIKGKSPEEIRKIFNIKNDFTVEEEEAVRKENEWIGDN